MLHRVAIIACWIAIAATSAAAAADDASAAKELTKHVRPVGSYHGSTFADASGWGFVKLDFGSGGSHRVSIQIAASQALYNLTCARESYRLADARKVSEPRSEALVAATNAIADAPSASSAVIAAALPDLSARRGCIFHRVKDGDFASIAVVGAVGTDALTEAAAAGTGAKPAKLVMDKWAVAIGGLPEPLPKMLVVELLPTDKAPRTEADLAQHFPEHRWRDGKKRKTSKLGIRPDRRDEEL